MINYWKEQILSRPEKRVSFYEYMSSCLYHPELGYYMHNKTKIGKQGDFYTSSSVHSVFAETIMEVAVDVCQKTGEPLLIYEMGAGTGLFAEQFLDALRSKYPEEYKRSTYILIEKSSFHRNKQEINLHKHAAQVRWMNALGQGGSVSGIFFSNELVDAFPVHLVEKGNDQLFEIGVTWNEEESKLTETLYPLENREVINYLERFGFTLTEGQRMEVPLEAVSWVEEVNQVFTEGLWLTIDYGYTNEELMLPQHRDGSLLCYDNHQRDANPYLKPGQKDLTYHIHFDVLRDVAVEFGWEHVGFYPQTDFLLRAGILNMLEEHQINDPFAQGALKKNRAIRQLISPEGISGSFQVLALAKGKFARPQSELNFTKPFSFQAILP